MPTCRRESLLQMGCRGDGVGAANAVHLGDETHGREERGKCCGEQRDTKWNEGKKKSGSREEEDVRLFGNTMGASSGCTLKFKI